MVNDNKFNCLQMNAIFIYVRKNMYLFIIIFGNNNNK